MTDLVDRLRNAQQPGTFVCQEAADEIERLRKLVTEAVRIFTEVPDKRTYEEACRDENAWLKKARAAPRKREAMSAEPLSEERITELRESVGVGFGDERDELFFELDRARSAESSLLARVAELEGETKQYRDNAVELEFEVVRLRASESALSRRLAAIDTADHRVIQAAKSWRECDTSQSADRGMSCGCLDLLADAVDALGTTPAPAHEAGATLYDLAPTVSDDPDDDVEPLL